MAFAPNPAGGKPGDTVTVPIVVSGMGSQGGYLEGAQLMFDRLIPASLGAKMLSSMYQKTFDAGSKDINTQLYPVNAESVQALQIIIPQDAPSAAYQIQVTLTDNVFDT